MEPSQSGPEFIGKYEVIGTLGRGSMGVVYLARDPEIGREVAIKVLRRIHASHYRDTDTALERFRSEARSAGRLRHPNIVTIFEASRDQDRPYLVMDYVQGDSLDTILAARGRLEPETVIYYLLQVAAGLDYAHSMGIVHRDIKPGNVIVDKRSRVFILDFGVAMISSSVSDDNPEQSKSSVVGTPGYMSPEQILNKQLGPRSDLFSFAIVAFECFSGKRPFPGENFTTVVGNILNGKPLSLTALVPELPLALEAEIERALAREPEARFGSAAEMLYAFCAALDLDPLGLTHTALPTTPEPRRRRKSTGWKSIRSMFWSPDSDVLTQQNDGATQVLGSESLTKLRAEHPAQPAHGSPTEELEPDRVMPPAGISRRATLWMLIMSLAAGACGAGLFWLMYMVPPASVPPDPGPRTAASPTEVAGEELPLPAYDPPPPDMDIYAMSDRELLGVIVTATSREEQVTAALRAARQRSLAGLAEACRVSLDHPSFLVRVETIRLLGELGDRRLVPYLVQKLSDSEAVVRGYAARSLGKLSDRRALGYLTARYMREEVPEVKMAIKKAIERINGFPMSE